VTALGPARGDGVGVEVTSAVIRAVRLASTEPGRVIAATEVFVVDRHDDRAFMDALVRLRVDIGDPGVPTRLALFPPGSTLSRLDATGMSGSDLNALREHLADSSNASSSVLVDDGPRRWLVGVSWDDTEIRRIEDLAERAGFIDVATDPSPMALARVLGAAVTDVRRDAATDESFGAMMSHGVVIAAAALDSIGRMSPGLTCGETPLSATWFDDLHEPTELVAEIRRLLEASQPVDAELQLAGAPYPPFPPHDLRAPQRQCVALGAALGAAGLAGRLRPVDVLAPVVVESSRIERPWAIERVSNAPAPAPASPIGPAKRLVARILPRRR
jgi:hypothetical protein